MKTKIINGKQWVQLVYCENCKWSQPSDMNRVYCEIKDRIVNKKSICEASEERSKEN